MVVLVLLVVALVAGALVAASVRRWPAADPASPRATSAIVRHEVESHPKLRTFVRAARVDPQLATGLLLTVATAVVIAGAVAVGVLFWMVRENAGLARVDHSFATWGATNATDFSSSILRAVTQLGSTVVIVAVAVAVGLLELRRPSVRRDARVPRARRRRAERDHQRRESARRPGPARHRSARRLLRPVLPERPLRGGRRHLRRVRAVARSRSVAARPGAGARAARQRSRRRSRRHGCCSASTGSPTCSPGSRWAGRGSRSCAIAFGGRLLRFGTPVEVAERADAIP